MAHYDCTCCGEPMGISHDHCDHCKAGKCHRSDDMAKPTPDDPLGQRPDPADFGEAMNAMIDARIEQRLRGRTSDRFNGVSDTHLVHELIARGWAVFFPDVNKRT